LWGIAGLQHPRLGAYRMYEIRRHGAGKSGAILTTVLLALQVTVAGSRFPGRVDRALADEEVLPSRQVVIIMRALAYDANLKTRAGGTINLGILYKKDNVRSEQMASIMTKAFGALASTPVAGLPIAVARLSYGGAEALRKSVGAMGIDILYVCEGLDGDVGAITEVTRRTKVLTVGSRQEQVPKGLSLGVFQVDGRTSILLNLPASRQEGAAFAADLLRLATVIR
jgi:hypothetical protein